MKDRLEIEHYTNENGYIVLTEKFHLKRGRCCGNICKHCPYKKQIKGNTEVKNNVLEMLKNMGII